MRYSREEVLASRWYPKPNDVIGGWCVMDVDKTPAETERPEVADFLDQHVAEHISDLHNEWLNRKHD